VNDVLCHGISFFNLHQNNYFNLNSTPTIFSSCRMKFNKEIDSVSKALLHLGFGYNSKIGLFSNNKPEWSISDYGIMGIRGIVVPFFGTATKVQ